MLQDSVVHLGYASVRWHDVYAINSAISTSDRNEKEEISYIGQESIYEDTCMSGVQLVKFICVILPCIFKHINGESGRPCHGIIAQDFEKLLKEVGLFSHNAFIKSRKTEEVKVKKEDGSKEVKIQEIPGSISMASFMRN